MNRGLLVVPLLLACTPAQQGQALVGVGVGLCGTGHGADAAGQSWGAVLAAAGCWLADWAADREDRRLEAERRAAREMVESPPAADLEPIDQAALDLAEARSRMVADPCPANFAVLEQALARCHALADQP